jgi:hypothetical protein
LANDVAAANFVDRPFVESWRSSHRERQLLATPMGNTVEANPKVADGKKYGKRGRYSIETRV